MDETKNLPSRKDFYSTIQEKSITKEEHDFALDVWHKFNIKNLTEYAELYCAIDCLLLAEIFQKFRKTMISFVDLDPCHYISLPGLGWDSMLKITKCQIGLPTEVDIIHFLESGIRGGLSFINTRHKRVVNKDLEIKKEEAIRYIDANNLYGLSQLQKLPYSNFEWLPKYHTATFNPNNIDDNGAKGFILEVDLEYPDDIHYTHNDFPLAPEHNSIELDDLSEYSRNCYLNTNKCKNYKSTKLTATFFDRKKYVIHIKNLKLYLGLGMKLKKIHRILQFDQEDFLKPFIEKCTNERKKAVTVFEKNQFKKLCNSCYGKTIENVRDYISVVLHTSDKTLKKALSKHTFKSFAIIDENLVATSHKLPSIYHNKPFAVGFTILEYVSFLINLSSLSKVNNYPFVSEVS